jgi:hypothetical protein
MLWVIPKQHSAFSTQHSAANNQIHHRDTEARREAGVGNSRARQAKDFREKFTKFTGGFVSRG